MYEINKNDPTIHRNRQQVKVQVERFRSVGKSEEEIIEWLENTFDEAIGLSKHFDSAHEVASFLNLPVSKFTIYWL